MISRGTHLSSLTAMIFAALPVSVLAQEPVYPSGSSFGLIPFDGAELADGFSGFADPATGASIVVMELPDEAFAEVSTAMRDPSALATQGIEPRSVEDVMIGGMPALQIAGVQRTQGLVIPKCLLIVDGAAATGLITAQIPGAPEGEDACALIKGVAERNAQTIEEKLAGLPFVLDDLNEFRVSRVIGGSGVILTDGPDDTIRATSQPIMVIASSLGQAPAEAERTAFSRQALDGLAGYEGITTGEAKNLVIAGAPANELRAVATADGVPVEIVQWTRFSNEGYVRMIGVAATEEWADTLPAFTAVRDGLIVP